MSSAVRMKAADLLLSLKVLTPEQHDSVSRVSAGMAERSEEVLITSGVMSEADVLKHLSAHYRTKFASSDKLSKADIPRATLEMIPRRVAETFMVFPVLFDSQTNALSVVTADPDVASLMKEIQLVSGAREVKAFFARPSAITALIQKHHGRDARAFDRFERERSTTQRGNQGGGQTLGIDGRMATGQGMSQTGAGAFAKAGAGSRPGEGANKKSLSVPKMSAARMAMSLDAPPLPPPVLAPISPAPAPHLFANANAPKSTTSLGRSMSARALDDPFAHDDQALRALAAPPGAHAAALALAEQTHRVAFLEGLIDMSNVLVSLLENNRADLRGHSSLVARLAKRMCERLTLPKEEMQAIVLAAHLHDLAKMASFHLTALNVADYDGHRAAAEKVVETPARLMEAVKLPAATSEALRQMYERWDGSGFPQKLSGKEISLGARILAVSDVYADLTQNPRNPYRKPLGAPEACSALEQHKERIFDPHLVDLFKTVVMGEDMKARLLETSRRALVIDPDPEESTVLELRMIEQGFEVLTARTVEAARTLLVKGDIELVVSELQLPDGNGLDLLSEARSSPWGKDLPWVIHTGVQHRSDAQRAFELGALDYVSKPAPTEVLVAKLRALTGAAKKAVARGVSGSLGEMGIPDIVQVLFQGRKTGKLLLRSGTFTGEIHFLEGAIADASFENKRGSDAFYMLMRLTEGEFVLDSSFVPPKRIIEESGETLLLEGLRRLDEGLV